MTLVAVGVAGVIALILLTSSGSGLDFDRRALAGAYRPARSRPINRFRSTLFRR
ncbi:hypothetical protein [Rhodococcoides navarretei]|uniref:Uncharacterized protein n=1 Tax=Rhodococcus navarretei TaxID=3128981 RepID=A0ABU9D1F9_9NOCA